MNFRKNRILGESVNAKNCEFILKRPTSPAATLVRVRDRAGQIHLIELGWSPLASGLFMREIKIFEF